MSNSNPPLLKLTTVQETTTPQTFQRGEAYYRNGRIDKLTRQGLTLWANCYGSQRYRTTVTLEEDSADCYADSIAIASYKCTCSDARDGRMCKHQVALLLTYIRQSERFEVIPPTAALLTRSSREALIELIEKMIQRYPDLLDLLDGSVAPASPQWVNSSQYRRQVQRALRMAEKGKIDESAIALENLLAEANRYWERGELEQAGMCYQLLLEETTAHYSGRWREWDGEGQLTALSQEFVKGLGECLAVGNAQLDSKMRQLWIDTLLEGFLKNLELGDLDYATDADEYLLECTTETEWSILEQRVRSEIHQSSDGTQRKLVRLLQERLERLGREEEAIAIANELGTPEQRAFLLIEEVKIEEAVELAQQHFSDYRETMLDFANALLDANAHKSALQLIYERWQSDRYEGYQQWLAKYHREYGTPEAALEWQESLLLEQPSADCYQQLQQLAEPLGIWEAVRDRVLNSLEQREQWQTLIEIALAEGAISRAIALYRQLIEGAIAQRDRAAYGQAIQYLQQLQALFEAIDAPADWNEYLQQLRFQYGNLAELQEEFDNANFSEF